MTRAGFPHSEIRASKPACGSTRLIAACHVLHRLPVPRHPPYALSILMVHWIALCGFQRTDASLSRAHAKRSGPKGRKLNSSYSQSRNPPPETGRNVLERYTESGELELEPCIGVRPVGHCCPTFSLER